MLCNRNYAKSYDIFNVTLCDENLENCCTTNQINTNQQFNDYGNEVNGSYIKDIDTSILGACKGKVLSDSLNIFINLQGTDGLCINYFELGEKSGGSLNHRTSTVCQHSQVHADSNQVRICPQDLSYEKVPIHCPSVEKTFLQKIFI